VSACRRRTRRESFSESTSDGITRCCDDCVDIDDDAVNTDDREAVDDEEQLDDDAGADAGASDEQPGPSVGLYLKDNMLHVQYLPASTLASTLLWHSSKE